MQMKKIILAFCVAVVATSCSPKNDSSSSSDTFTDTAGNQISAADAPVISFEKEIYDFGIITDGDTASYEFKFTNTGKTPLIIANATATCGCTEPIYPTTPVKPGETGVVKVAFNSAGKVGVQDKVITLTSNANPNINSIHMVGEVKAKVNANASSTK